MGRSLHGSQGARQLPCNTWEWPGTYKLYCSRPLPALAGRGLTRTLCCAVCAMKGSVLGRCSMQLAGGCLIHKLYPLTFSFATRPLSAFAGRGLVVKQYAMPFFLITVCISLIIPNTECVCHIGAMNSALI